MFRLFEVQSRYTLVFEYYYDFMGHPQSGIMYDYTKFLEKLNLNSDTLKNKILSYNAKFYVDRNSNIMFYFKNEQDGQNLVDELNIILKLTGG